MPLKNLSVSGYRSLRDIRLSLAQLNVVTGPNGSGKSNLYRALWLLAQMCEGEFARSLAREGGFLSAMWAGPKRDSKPQRMKLGFSTEDLSFEMACGFPVPSSSQFAFDPEIKEELVWFGDRRKPSSTLLTRKAGMTSVRDANGQKIEYPLTLTENESVLSQLREPHRFPELFTLRDEVRRWRFYHHFRTDESSALRAPQIGVRTPVLSHDGSDLAAALQTVIEIGDAQALYRAIDSAFPGRALQIVTNDDQPLGKSPRATELSVALETDGCLRPLLARELSDGTLRFLCLAAALLSPRPPSLIALNEPEGSMHPDLMEPLADLIVAASDLSQLWVTTHSPRLVAAIRDRTGVLPIELQLENGETLI